MYTYVVQPLESFYKLRSVLFCSSDGKKFLWTSIMTPTFLYLPIIWNEYLQIFTFFSTNDWCYSLYIDRNIFHWVYILPDYFDLRATNFFWYRQNVRYFNSFSTNVWETEIIFIWYIYYYFRKKILISSNQWKKTIRQVALRTMNNFSLMQKPSITTSLMLKKLLQAG